MAKKIQPQEEDLFKFTAGTKSAVNHITNDNLVTLCGVLVDDLAAPTTLDWCKRCSEMDA